MINRAIFEEIKLLSNQYPVLALTGPRQSGKTTMLKTMFPDYKYITLENPDNREFAERDPKGFLNAYHEKVIFDEAQNTPTLFSYIQGIVDDSGKMGQFILSGLQNFQLMERISQSLAGRVAIFNLLPFENKEMKTANWLEDKAIDAIPKGFYPAIFERGADHDRYYANYISTYINRDVSQLMNIHDLRSFKTFVKLCALRTGSLLNLSDLARDTGISHTTARNWISILETSFIVYLLPPYYRNYGKRLVKSSKLYFYDTGLASHLIGIRKSKLTPTHPMWGQLFENMVLMELIKQNAHRNTSREFSFWRDSKGHEVDVLIEDEGTLHLYEIKASSTIQNKMFAGLDYFNNISEGENIAEKNLVYSGDEAQNRTDYQIIPWNQLELT